MFINNLLLRNHQLEVKQYNERQEFSKGPYTFQKLVTSKLITQKKYDFWSYHSKMKYLAFIDYFQQELTDKKGKSLWPLFKMMSCFVNDHNSNQCRIYHNSMIKAHLNIESILANFQHRMINFKTILKVYVDEIRQFKIKYGLSQQKKRRHQSNHLQGNYQFRLNGMSQSCIADSQKSNKQDQIKTDVSYPAQPQIKRYSTTSKPSFFSNSFGQVNPLINYHNFFQQKSFLGHQNDKNDPTSNKSKQWMQCHQLFLAWTTKLQSLIENQ